MQSGGSRGWAIDLLSWFVLAGIGSIVLTQAFGVTRVPIVAVLQVLTPYLTAVLALVVLLAVWRGQLLAVTAGVAIGFGILVLSTPLAFPDPGSATLDGAAGLRVASANLLYLNTQVTDISGVLHDLDPDVIVFSEYTREHQSALLETDLAEEYPHHVDLSGRAATGIALWSRTAPIVHDPLDTSRPSIDVEIDGPDGPVRIVAMHMATPNNDFEAWRHDLATGARIGRAANGPTLLIGDLNSSYWHPDFRRLLDAGFVDAHIAAGKGFSTSWPTDWSVPRFVRLDHALTAGGLVSTDVEDFEIPGSDHRGLVVTVAPAPPAVP